MTTDQHIWLKRTGDTLTGDLNFGNNKIIKLGDPSVPSDGARFLDVQALGKVTTQIDLPVFTGVVTGNWSVGISPAVDQLNVWKIYDRNNNTFWECTNTIVTSYSITLQAFNNAFLECDRISLVKSGVITNFRVTINGSDRVAQINTPDDEGTFALGARYIMSFVQLTFTASPGAKIYTVNYLKQQADMGQVVTVHTSNLPNTVVTKNYVDGNVLPLLSFVNTAYVLPIFTGPTMPGFTATASSEVFTNPGWKCLDRNPATYWSCSDNTEVTLIIQLTNQAAQALTVQLQGRIDDVTQNFDSWILSGSTDGVAYVDLASDISVPLELTNIPLTGITALYSYYKFTGLNSAPGNKTCGLSILNLTYGAITLNDYRISSLADPLDPLDAVNKQYVDGLTNTNTLITAYSYTVNAMAYSAACVSPRRLIASAISGTPLTNTTNILWQQGLPDMQLFDIVTDPYSMLPGVTAFVSMDGGNRCLASISVQIYEDGTNTADNYSIYYQTSDGPATEQEGPPVTKVTASQKYLVLSGVFQTGDKVNPIAISFQVRKNGGLSPLLNCSVVAGITTLTSDYAAVTSARIGTEHSAELNSVATYTLPVNSFLPPFIVADRLEISSTRLGINFDYNSANRVVTFTLPGRYLVSLVVNLTNTLTSTASIDILVCSAINDEVLSSDRTISLRPKIGSSDRITCTVDLPFTTLIYNHQIYFVLRSLTNSAVVHHNRSRITIARVPYVLPI